MSGNIESVSSSWLDAIKDLFLGISSDDYIYATALIFCVAFGFMYKKIKERSKKEIIGSVVGIMLVMATCRLQAIIPFGFVIGNICLQKYFHSTIVTIYGFGLAYSPFTNIILMFLCLRMVSLAFEIHDNITLKTGQILHCSSALKVEVKSEESVGEDSEHSRAPLQAPLADTSENNKNSSRYADLTKDDKGRATIRKKVDGVREIPPMEERSQTKEKSKHSKPPLEHIPNSLEIWHYAFNYIGILTGPFVRYNTYCDMLNLPFSQEAKVRGPLFKCLSSLPLTVLLYILFSRWYPLEVMVTSDFYNSTSFWHRLGYCIFIFIKFRMRFYAAFALSESVCITAGLGAYPVELNPKPGKGISDRTEAYRLASMGKPLFYNFETVRNVDLAATEFGSVKEAMRAWNLSVQYWLASCVYSRFKGPRSIRQVPYDIMRVAFIDEKQS
ncbi:unnamed protein product [Darwinula stevensoni]|uniref:Lysophospholipid acyltransferase 7 n=1 Tax=Darwinula stevensoni TaxID=69355 RepID=A0A7R8XEK8_9CRUS|nr:unnamed protein product [Darwinula stevensoni]CAG0889695.1 unnamed protein product [Darwinula stevensoni]